MEKEPLAKLVWHGDDTIETVRGLLDTAQSIEITLPASYNHALFRAFNPGAADAVLEDLDVHGDAELLTTVARVHGLEALADLRPVLEPLPARVHVLSPPTLIIDLAAYAA